MPYEVQRTDRCPTNRPFGVVNPESGRLHGCHDTEESARRQQAALYANVPDARGASEEMEHKTFELLETKTDGDAGTFTALASVFGNVDRVGDRMLPGSFTKTLENWRQSGKPIPVILSHNWDDPHKYVGEADPRAVYEDDRGLVVQGKMYTEEDLGRKVYELMKRNILTGWSFGYKVPQGGQKQKNGVNEISEVELFEVGPTLVGANPDAQLESIKSALGVETEEMEEITPELDEKAVWSTAYVNNLPDSAFLYIEPGGEKDSDGRTTPRSLRHFPVRDANGNVDQAHVRNALARIPQSNVPQAAKDRATAAARRLLTSSASIETEQDGAHEEPSPAKSRPDALRKESRLAALKVLSDGASLKEPTPPPKEPEPEMGELIQLRRDSRRAVLKVLSGGQIDD